MRVTRSNLGTIVLLNNNDRLYDTVKEISEKRDEDGMTRLISLFRVHNILGDNIREHTIPLVMYPPEEWVVKELIILFPSTDFCNNADQHKVIIKAMLMQLNSRRTFEEINDKMIADNFYDDTFVPDEKDATTYLGEVKTVTPEIKRYYCLAGGNTYKLSSKKQICEFKEYASAFYKYKNEYYMVAKEQVMMDDFLEPTEEDVTSGMKIEP